MPNHTEPLATVLDDFVTRAGYTPGRLAQLTTVPQPTLTHWLEGG